MSKFLIVGLGNPGAEYAKTRHNLGWHMVEALAARYSANIREENSLHTLLADIRVDHGQALLSMPTTYMNESGRAVQAVAQYFKIPLTQILLVQDELDFPFGTFAFRDGGNAGGHNGIGSVYEQTGTTQFARLRLGIGRPPEHVPAKDYVLQTFSAVEQIALPELTLQVGKAIEDWMRVGLTKAMNVWNGVKHDPSTRTNPLGNDRPL